MRLSSETGADRNNRSAKHAPKPPCLPNSASVICVPTSSLHGKELGGNVLEVIFTDIDIHRQVNLGTTNTNGRTKYIIYETIIPADVGQVFGAQITVATCAGSERARCSSVRRTPQA